MSHGAPAHSEDHHPPHPYHLVNPSPWPLLGAFGAFLLTFGAVRWWHGGDKYVLYAGFATVILTMILWWRDVIHEAQVEKVHNEVVRHGLRFGMALFITSEVMFFVAFFWAFFHNSLLVSPVITHWPPANIEPMEVWGIPFLNTLLLLLSGFTVTWAHHGLLHGNRKDLKWGLVCSIILGVTFLSLQLHEYGAATFGFKEGIFPSVFYMATGFHGFHVTVGVIFLTVCLIRSLRGDFEPHHHVGFEAAAWYWHFVDVVWIFLFVWVYWWGSHGAG